MDFEAEVLAGLGPFVEDELGGLGAAVTARSGTALRFRYAGPVRALLDLRTAVAVYAVDRFSVPRPKALLGEQHLRTIVARIGQVRTLGQFSSFRFSAAGRESSVFQRLAREVTARTGLAFDDEAGELVLRVHPAAGEAAWEVLYRLSPRPLSARPWRLRDRRGALNATIAAAMVAMVGVGRRDRFLNVACGTGTLLIERVAAAPAALAAGLDTDARALADAEVNLSAAGLRGQVQLLRGDATSMPFPPASIDALVADLPYGSTMGSATENERLYPAVLAASARVARPGAPFAVITHDIRRFEAVVAASPAWSDEGAVQVFQKGHHPHVWLLRRRP